MKYIGKFVLGLWWVVFLFCVLIGWNASDCLFESWLVGWMEFNHPFSNFGYIESRTMTWYDDDQGEPVTGTQCPTLYEESQGIFYMHYGTDLNTCHSRILINQSWALVGKRLVTESQAFNLSLLWKSPGLEPQTPHTRDKPCNHSATPPLPPLSLRVKYV